MLVNNYKCYLDFMPARGRSPASSINDLGVLTI